MLDREGYRPNVGIILVNQKNEVFWGKRIREHSWQFPQGGIKYGETPVQAMYRELQEEVGLKPEHVRILGRTRDWLRYNVPDNFVRRDSRGHYKGQKQIWFLLRLVGKDSDVSLRATHHPEFDAWRWHTYWVPLDVVIEFKRDVYQRALKELSDILFRRHGESRYLRHRNAGHGAAPSRKQPAAKAAPAGAGKPVVAAGGTPEGTPSKGGNAARHNKKPGGGNRANPKGAPRRTPDNARTSTGARAPAQRAEAQGGTGRARQETAIQVQVKVLVPR